MMAGRPRPRVQVLIGVRGRAGAHVLCPHEQQQPTGPAPPLPRVTDSSRSRELHLPLLTRSHDPADIAVPTLQTRTQRPPVSSHTSHQNPHPAPGAQLPFT